MMRIQEQLNHPATAYVLTTVEALAQEQNGQLWIDPGAQCYLQGVAPPAATIKVRYASSPGGRDRFEASIHQGQAGIAIVGTCPAGWVGITPTEFD
jgi:hypothetical protein